MTFQNQLELGERLRSSETHVPLPEGFHSVRVWTLKISNLWTIKVIQSKNLDWHTAIILWLNWNDHAHPKDDWEEELQSNFSTFVCFDQYGRGKVATFCKLPVSLVNHGKNTVSKTSNILSIVDESCFNDISGTAEIIQAEGELDVLTNMVEYSGTPKIVGHLGFRICCYRSTTKL